MNTITAILEPAADGSLHLPVPEELRHTKIKVVALLTAVDTSDTGDAPANGSVRAWAREARGSVRLQPGESADDVRRAYYQEKYGSET